MKKNIYRFVSLGLIITLLIIVILPSSVKAITLSNSFLYTFNSNGTLIESGSLSESTSPYWWLNSGAALNIVNGRGSTVQGSLPVSSPWRALYAANNPLDTDNGYHPQNIFRLVSKVTAQNVREDVYFVIKADQLSDSPNRNSSNGLLLFSRYQSGATLYYAGVRVDGAAVIKKKINGTYYTLAYKKIFPGSYDSSSNPNLLPKNKWIGLRTETINNTDGSVSIKLYTDIGWTGVWTLVSEALDDGKSFGGSAITAAGNTGIRTDFMDVEFDNFRLRNI